MMANKNNNEDQVKTRIVIENDDNRFVWESPYADVTMDDMLNAFYGLLVGCTWLPYTVISSMKDFVEEHQYVLDKYDPMKSPDDNTDHDEPNLIEDEPQPHFYA